MQSVTGVTTNKPTPADGDVLSFLSVFCFCQYEEQAFVVAQNKHDAVKVYAENCHRNYIAVQEDSSGDLWEREYLFTLYEEGKPRLGGGVRVYQYEFKIGKVYP